MVGILAAHTASKWADLVGNDQQFKEKVLPKTRDLLAVLAVSIIFISKIDYVIIELSVNVLFQPIIL